MIFAIDPGNVFSAYVICDDELKPIEFGKVENGKVIHEIRMAVITYEKIDFAIEMVASYGMPVGAEVFETCVWIGRFLHEIGEAKLIYRKDEKMNLCHSMRANDATIKQALVDRFAKGTSNHGKGTKNNPGWFYGFKADIWAAYAVAVTYHDLKKVGSFEQ